MREWLKILRCENSLTQSEISQKLGISESYYSLIENGERKKQLDLELASKIAKIFNISVEDIANEECGANEN